MSKLLKELKDKISDLEAKLAEKEKEIERLREISLDVPIKQMQFHHNQDKISFAVEQLEKVKERMKKGYHYGIYNQNLIEYIDNQIKELKEMK